MFVSLSHRGRLLGTKGWQENLTVIRAVLSEPLVNNLVIGIVAEDDGHKVTVQVAKVVVRVVLVGGRQPLEVLHPVPPVQLRVRQPAAGAPGPEGRRRKEGYGAARRTARLEPDDGGTEAHQEVGLCPQQRWEHDCEVVDQLAGDVGAILPARSARPGTHVCALQSAAYYYRIGGGRTGSWSQKMTK